MTPARVGRRVVLAEQLAIWSAFRAGQSEQTIAATAQRLPAEIHAILRGRF